MSDIYDILPVSEKYISASILTVSKRKNDVMLRDIIKRTKRDEGIPNLLLYGPPGSGKYVRSLAIIHQFFSDIPYSSIRNCTIRAINIEDGSFCPIPGTSGMKKTEKAVLVMTSPIHCELDMDQPNAEKSLMNFLEFYSRSRNIALNCHKYVVIRHAERIKFKTQHSLRKVMEMKSHNIRFIILCRSLNNWIDPLRSRFILLSVPGPSLGEAKAILKDVARKEGWKMTRRREELIIENSREGLHNGINIGTLLLVAEGSFLQSKNLKNKRSFKVYTPWRRSAVDKIYRSIKSGDREEMREVLGEIYLQDHIQIRDILMKDLLRRLLADNPEERNRLIDTASRYDTRIADDHIFYPLLVAEAYILAVADILQV